MYDNSCEIRIYDKDFNWINSTFMAESVQFKRELYSVGSFEIHIHPEEIGAFDLANRGNIITINRDGHKSGIIRDFYVEEDRRKGVFVIYGQTGNGLASQRITVPPTQAQDSNALGWDKKNGAAETLLKHYAGRNLTSPFDSKRKMERLVMAADQQRGESFPWKSRYAKLEDELEGIGDYSEMGWEIYADIPNKTWVFDIIPGIDRTKNQTTVSPVTFRMEYQNVEKYKYTEDGQNFRNTGYSGGQGTDEKRLVYILGTENTGQGRFETFLDCGNAENISELIYYGEQKMVDHQMRKTIEAQALPRTFVFEKDYFIGDQVSVMISRLGLTIETRITAVTEIWEAKKGYQCDVRFGGKLPNLFTILKRREEIY